MSERPAVKAPVLRVPEADPPMTFSASQFILTISSGDSEPSGLPLTIPVCAWIVPENGLKEPAQIVCRSSSIRRFVPIGRLFEQITSTTPEEIPHQ